MEGTRIKEEHPPSGSRVEKALRLLYLLVLLFGFLVAIELMSKAIKGFGSGALGEESSVFALAKNPFAALSLGALFTVLVQSSSTTTSTIVAMVGSGVLSVGAAVPMVMGANIGTTITNRLVAIGHVRRSEEFRRAFSAATVHDFFNLICVAVMFPLEVWTGFLTHTAEAMTGALAGTGGASYKSPIKGAIKSVVGVVKDGLGGVGLEGGALYGVQLALGIALIRLADRQGQGGLEPRGDHASVHADARGRPPHLRRGGQRVAGRDRHRRDSR